MTYSQPELTVTRPVRSLASAPCPVTPTMAISIYGCGVDEAALFRAAAPRFGVLPLIIEAAPSEASSELAVGSRCISVGHQTKINNRTLRAFAWAGVEYICTRSIGYNHLDVEYAADLGITVHNVDYSPDSVADHTLMLILMVIRRARSVIRRIDSHDYRLGPVRGRELRDLTVGVVGAGRIGSAVIDRLRGFGCRIVAHDNHRGAAVDHLDLDQLLRQSDVVTLHTPLTAGTHHLLDRRRIAQLRSGAFVINTGRGGLIDTAALVAALQDGRLAGAGLDVLEDEDGIFYTDRRDRPPRNRSLALLQQLPNVVITPHVGYDTDHALRDIVENTLINCRTFESRRDHG